MPSDIPKDMVFDVRILERNVRKGLVTAKEVDGYNASLKDRADNTAQLEARLDHSTSQAPSNVAPISAARKREEEEEMD